MMLNMANAQFAKSFWIQFQHYSTCHFCFAACGGRARHLSGKVTFATLKTANTVQFSDLVTAGSSVQNQDLNL